MTTVSATAAMLWTGGKDSALALFEAVRGGWHVRCLVTFAPPRPAFLAHPLAVMRLQAQALGLPHHIMTVTAPFEAGYELALRRLRDETGVDGVISGDIAEVNDQPNWLRERCAPIGLSVHTPLWGRDRETLLRSLLDHGFRVVVSCVDTRRLDASWVGRELNEAALAELRAIRQCNGLDLCGENGEYHTLVIDGPRSRWAIDIKRHAVRVYDGLAYMDIHDIAAAPAGDAS